MTTSAHVDAEAVVSDLTKRFAADLSAALPVATIERATEQFLASRPDIDTTKAQWKAQRRCPLRLPSDRPLRRPRRGSPVRDLLDILPRLNITGDARIGASETARAIREQVAPKVDWRDVLRRSAQSRVAPAASYSSCTRRNSPRRLLKVSCVELKTRVILLPAGYLSVADEGER